MNKFFKYSIPVFISPIVLLNLSCSTSELSNKKVDFGLLFKMEAELENNPRDEELLYKVAFNYWWQLADVDKAQDYYERLLTVNPKHITSHYELAQVLHMRGRYAESSHHFRVFLEMTKSSQGRCPECIAHAKNKLSAYEKVSVDKTKTVTWVEEGNCATNSIGMSFVRIPQGTFERRYGKSLHEVTLDAYWIGKYEVTAGQFKQFLEESGYTTRYMIAFKPINNYARTKDHPVIYVSWYDAVAFTRWLSSREGAVYRLPSEAEWEFAARGFDGRINPWGNQEAVEGVHANVHRLKLIRYHGDRPTLEKVGNYPAGKSYFGLYDMAGNVSEWCLDIYDSKFFKRSPARNPFGPVYVKGKVQCVLRGGSWRHLFHPTGFAVMRFSYDSTVAYNQFGFRVVREIEADTIDNSK